MSGFYRRPLPGSPLNQGDIFTDVPIIAAAFAPLLQVIFEGSQVRVEEVASDALRDEIVLVEKVTLTRAILLTQSCDAERVSRLELAPLSPLTLEEKSDAKRWRRISTLATSLYETKTLYVPGNTVLGLNRSVADFGEVFTLPRSLLEELARKDKRVASLSPDYSSALKGETSRRV